VQQKEYNEQVNILSVRVVMYYMMDKTAVDIALNEGIHEATIQCISVLMDIYYTNTSCEYKQLLTKLIAVQDKHKKPAQFTETSINT
jgi:hypothetical protein